MIGARYLLLLLLPSCDQLFKINELAPDANIDARPLPPHCFAEGFDGTSVDPASWTVASAAPRAPTISVTEHELVIAAQADETGSNYNSIRSTSKFDLTDGQVIVELLEPTLQQSDAPSETQFYIEVDAANRYQFSILLGAVTARLRMAGGDTLVKSTTYLASSFHWLRFRHDAEMNQMAWEVATKEAPDEWASLGTTVALLPVTQLHVDLGAGTYNPVSQPGRARFDNVLVVAPACNL